MLRCHISYHLNLKTPKFCHILQLFHPVVVPCGGLETELNVGAQLQTLPNTTKTTYTKTVYTPMANWRSQTLSFKSVMNQKIKKGTFAI